MKAKTSKPNVGHFFIETWGQNIVLLWPATRADIARFIWNEYRERYEETDPYTGTCVSVDSKFGNHIVIAFREWTWSCRMMGTLAHEAFHAAEYILERRGMRHSEETSEAYAYLLGEIVRRSLGYLPTDQPPRAKRL